MLNWENHRSWSRLKSITQCSRQAKSMKISCFQLYLPALTHPPVWDQLHTVAVLQESKAQQNLTPDTWSWTRRATSVKTESASREWTAHTQKNTSENTASIFITRVVVVIKRISLYSSDTYKAPPVLSSWPQSHWSWRWCWGTNSRASDRQSSDPLRTECRCCKTHKPYISAPS